MTIHSVLLVEDEIGTRLAMCDKILAHPDLSLYSAVGSCEEALHCMSRGVDVLLTDLGLPDGSGISLVKHAKTLPCPPEVMVVTTFGDEANVVAAITAGASSYLLKDQGFDTLADSICAMLNGESSIDSRVARFLLSRLSDSPPAQTAQVEHKPKQHPVQKDHLPESTHHDQMLSSREVEVLELVSKGMTYAETGGILNISENTIRAHIRNIYTKLAVNSRFEAVYEATVMGLIKPTSKLA